LSFLEVRIEFKAKSGWPQRAQLGILEGKQEFDELCSFLDLKTPQLKAGFFMLVYSLGMEYKLRGTNSERLLVLKQLLTDWFPVTSFDWLRPTLNRCRPSCESTPPLTDESDTESSDFSSCDSPYSSSSFSD